MGFFSKVRQSIFPEAKQVRTDVTVSRGIVNCKLEGTKNKDCSIYSGNYSRIVTYVTQKQDNERYWFAAFWNKTNDIPDKKQLISRFHEYHPTLQKMLDVTSNEQIHSAHLHEMPISKTWHKGRVCLMGMLHMQFCQQWVMDLVWD